MVTLISIFHVIICIFLILVVLLQAGKGGGVGAALGGQTSAQVFGGRGAGSFLERLTAGTAMAFMVTSMSLAYIASRSDNARLQKISQEAAAKKKIDDQKAADAKVTKDAEDRAAGDKKPDTKTDTKTDDAPVEEAAPTDATKLKLDAPKMEIPGKKMDAPVPPPLPAPAPADEPAKK